MLCGNNMKRLAKSQTENMETKMECEVCQITEFKDYRRESEICDMCVRTMCKECVVDNERGIICRECNEEIENEIKKVP